MKETRIKWLKLFLSSFWFIFQTVILYEILTLPLRMMKVTTGTDQLMWIMLFCFSCFAIKINFPDIESYFYDIWKPNEKEVEE